MLLLFYWKWMGLVGAWFSVVLFCFCCGNGSCLHFQTSCSILRQKASWGHILVACMGLVHSHIFWSLYSVCRSTNLQCRNSLRAGGFSASHLLVWGEGNSTVMTWLDGWISQWIHSNYKVNRIYDEKLKTKTPQTFGFPVHQTSWREKESYQADWIVENDRCKKYIWTPSPSPDSWISHESCWKWM